jgi:hypothetical protein
MNGSLIAESGVGSDLDELSYLMPLLNLGRWPRECVSVFWRLVVPQAGMCVVAGFEFETGGADEFAIPGYSCGG